MRVKVGVSVFDPTPDPLASPQLRYEPFTALVDTGAQRTCVTQNVVDKIGLKRRGRVEVGNVRGLAQHWTYLFHIGIWPDPDGDEPPTVFGIGDEIEGFDLGDSRYFNVLLGMDILQRGSLKLDLDGSFELAFPG